MRRFLPIFFGCALFLHAEEGGTNGVLQIKEALTQWHTETDAMKKATLADSIVHQCGVAERPEFAEELISGKPLEEARKSMPTNAVPLPLTVIKEWNFLKRDGCEYGFAAVIRRIGKGKFELWTPKQGWLFDTKGDVLIEAKVPRRDGSGREWYGAFLPSGEWITTDLWDHDDRLYIFSPESKLLRAFTTKKYTGQPPDNPWYGHSVAWARADSTGKQWVAQIGLDGGWCGLLISSWDWRRRVSSFLVRLHLPSPSSWVLARKVADPITYTDRRELGSRGSIVHLTVESTDGKSSLEYCGHMHGAETELPEYSMRGAKGGWDHVIPEIFHGKYTGSGNFGFFPNSQIAWIGGEKTPTRPNQHHGGFRSWLIEPSGKAIGWLPAERVGDDSNGKRMWFVDEQGRLLKVAPDGVVSEVFEPTLAVATGENAPFAHVLFPDLKLGFFYTKPGHLVLARWP